MCGVKETQCSHCDHLQVCSYKEQFLAAQKAVDEVRVQIGDSVAKKPLNSFEWIRPVSLECIHFSKQKPTMRSEAEVNCARSAAYEASGI